MKYRTEDEVRDSAKLILGFDKIEPKVKQGTGQITTFNQLGFKGIIDKPDGWYLPDDKGIPAIILETKSEAEDISLQKWVKELTKNCNIALTQYKHVVGILYNGKEVRIFLDNIEAESTAPTLQDKSYYLTLFTKNTIDKQQIYNLTKRINDCLHIDFGIKNLYHRMIFTACALVGKRYGALLVKGMDFTLMKNSILSTLSKSLEESRKQNLKLDLLIEVYSEIKMNNTTNQDAIDNFIEWIAEISDCVNSDFWNGEDVMGILFNEFNRYKKKSDSGQVFTPDHITSFMYRLIEVDKDDRVLDAACGSGAFLVKAMCNMVKAAGGVKTKKAATIKDLQLYGIEFDREIFALACANMLIHKDGKTNLEQLDSRTQEACDWIKSKGITKVLMNPPFESKYGCLVIVDNVLKSVPKGTKCAFILPDKKLEKDRKGKKLLGHSTLHKIIKLPEKVFSEGVTTSIFIFEAGVPQKGRDIFACYIEDDGLETVKNQGRQDTKDKWSSIEDAWIDIIRKQSGHTSIQWLNPSEYLSYQMPKKEFSVHSGDFSRAVMDYLMFLQGIDSQSFVEVITKKLLYSSKVQMIEDKVSLVLHGDNCRVDGITTNDEMSIQEVKINTWSSFALGQLFDVVKGSRLTKAEMRSGTMRYIGASSFNNGITTYISNDEHVHPANTLTVCYNGSDIGRTFYQSEPYWATDDVNVLYPKFEMNENIALFFAPIIKCVGGLHEYDDKWKLEDMKKDTIRLPVKEDGTPNFDYMQSYIHRIRWAAEKRIAVLQNL